MLYSHAHFYTQRQQVMHATTMQQLLVSWAFLLSFLTSAISQAPRLSKTLRESYTINPSLQPRFTACLFNGNPPLTITWTYNGQRVPDMPQGSGPYVDPSTGSLVLSEATPGDSGSYTCTATNSAGSDSASTQIVIIRNRGPPWYVDWYMIFIYSLVVWALLIPAFIGWWFYTKRKFHKNLPPADPWLGN